MLKRSVTASKTATKCRTLPPSSSIGYSISFIKRIDKNTM
jgi:hypothetical protein